MEYSEFKSFPSFGDDATMRDYLADVEEIASGCG